MSIFVSRSATKIIRVPEGPQGSQGAQGPAGPRPAYATWALLSVVVGASGANAEVPTSDTGTHTDPVVGGTVSNSGIYAYSAAPAGWRRIGDLDSLTSSTLLTAVRTWSGAQGAVLTKGGYFLKAGGVSTNSGYQRLLYQVTGAELGFRATANLGGSSMALAVFYSTVDGSGTPLGYFQVGDNAAHTQAVFTPPTGTVSIGISGQIQSGLTILPFSLETLGYISGDTLTHQSLAAYRAPTRAALLAAGSIPTAYGNMAQVFGYAAQGDAPPHQYVRGGTLLPTGTGWGLSYDASLPAQAFGISAPLEEGSPSSTEIFTDLLAATTESVEDALADENYLTLPQSGLYTPQVSDSDKLLYASLASGATLEVDLAHIPINRVFNFSTGGNATGRMVLDVGWRAASLGQAQWMQTGSRYLQVNAGWSISVVRKDLANFVVLSALSLAASPTAAPATPTSFTRTVRAASAAYAGQSIFDLGFGRGAEHASFINRLASLGGSVPATTDLWNISYGGSAVCQADCDPGNPTNYWVDMTNPAAPADGPNLTAAMAVIAARNGDMNQPALSYILFNLGYQSAVYIDTPGAPNPSFTAATFTTGINYIWSRLRSAAGNANLPIGMSPIGHRTTFAASLAGGMQVVREALLAIAAADAHCFLAGELWDLPLRDAAHPTEWAYNLLGQRDADAVARNLYAATGTIQSPTVTSATVNAALNTIDVVIRTQETNTRFFRVANPIGFKVSDASGNDLPISRVHWTDVQIFSTYFQATLRLFLSSNPTGGTLYHVWDWVPGFDPARAIRTWASQGGKPLRSAKIAL